MSKKKRKPLLTEKDKDNLYRIIKTVFIEELNERNCFTFSEVVNKVDKDLKENGFSQINREILALSGKFYIGFNEDNKLSISFKDYPEDEYFTTYKKSPEQLTQFKQNLPIARQKQLEAIILKKFTQDLEESNRIPLSSIRNKLGLKLKGLNFQDNLVNLFLRSPEIFTLDELRENITLNTFEQSELNDDSEETFEDVEDNNSFEKENEEVNSIDIKEEQNNIEFDIESYLADTVKFLRTRFPDQFLEFDVVVKFLTNSKVIELPTEIKDYVHLTELLYSYSGLLDESRRKIRLRNPENESMDLPVMLKLLRSLVSGPTPDDPLTKRALKNSLQRVGLSLQKTEYGNLSTFIEYSEYFEEFNSKEILLTEKAKDLLNNYYENLRDDFLRLTKEQLLSFENDTFGNYLEYALEANDELIWNLILTKIHSFNPIFDLNLENSNWFKIVNSKENSSRFIKLNEEDGNLLQDKFGGYTIDSIHEELLNRIEESQNKFNYYNQSNYQKQRILKKQKTILSLIDKLYDTDNDQIIILLYRLSLLKEIHTYQPNDFRDYFYYLYNYDSSLISKEIEFLTANGIHIQFSTIVEILFYNKSFDEILKLVQTLPEDQQDQLSTSANSLYQYTRILLEIDDKDFPNLPNIFKKHEKTKVVSLTLEFLIQNNLNILVKFINHLLTEVNYFDQSLLKKFLLENKEYFDSKFNELVLLAKNNISFIISVKFIIDTLNLEKDTQWSSFYKNFKEKTFKEIDDLSSIGEKRNHLLRWSKYFNLDQEYLERLLILFSDDLSGIHPKGLRRLISKLYSQNNYDLIVYLVDNYINDQDKINKEFIYDSIIQIGDYNTVLKRILDDFNLNKDNRITAILQTRLLKVLGYLFSEAQSVFSENDYRNFIRLLKGGSVGKTELLTVFKLVLNYSILKQDLNLAALIILTTPYKIIRDYIAQLENIQTREVLFIRSVLDYIDKTSLNYIFRHFLIDYTGDFIMELIHLISSLMKFNVLFIDKYQNLKDKEIFLNETNEDIVIKFFLSQAEDKEYWYRIAEYYKRNGNRNEYLTFCFLLFYGFNDYRNIRSECMLALETYKDEELPSSFLVNNALIFTRNYFWKPYWETLREHLRRNKSFVNTKKDQVKLSEIYFHNIVKKNKIQCNDLDILLEILYQDQETEQIYNWLFNQENIFKNDLLPIEKKINMLGAFSGDPIIIYPDLISNTGRLLNSYNSSQLEEKYRNAIYWIEYLNSLPKESHCRSFFEKSRAILIDFPNEPTDEYINSFILSDLNSQFDLELISLWLSTYSSKKNYLKAYEFLIEKRPNNQLRKRYYQLMTEILDGLLQENYITENYSKYSLKELFTYLITFQILAHDLGSSPDSLLNRFSVYLSSEEKDELKDLINVLNPFLFEEQDEFYTELIYLALIKDWNNLIKHLAHKPIYQEKRIQQINDLLNYFRTIDLDRLLIELYIGSYYQQRRSDSSLRVEYENSFKDFKEVFKETDYLLESFSKRVSRILKDENIFDDEENILKIRRLLRQGTGHNIIKILNEETWIAENWAISLASILVTSEVLENAIAYLIDQKKELSIKFLENINVINKLNNQSLIYFYKIAYYLKIKDYQKAEEELTNFKQLEKVNYNLLEQAIDAVNRRSILKLDSITTTNIKRLPRLSYMFTRNPEGTSPYLLMRDFFKETDYSRESYLEKRKIAEKIYYYYDNEDFLISEKDAYEFLFLWGKYAIETSGNIENKFGILFDLLENIDLLEPASLESYQEFFITVFDIILKTEKFNFLFKNLNQIISILKLLDSKFELTKNSIKYSVYLELLNYYRDLEYILNSGEYSEELIRQAKEITRKILALKLDNPYDAFINFSDLYAQEYIRRIKEKGVLEARILNEDGLIDNSIFFQVKNIGVETISDLKISLYINHHLDETVEIFDLYNEEFKKLLPGQTFVSEYTPNIDLSENKDIECVIQVQYENKNYIAVDKRNGGLLKVKKNKETFIESSKSYFTRAISARDFIKRDKLIQNISNSLFDQNTNVVLYGTNGTGKTSLLNYFDSAIGAYFSDSDIQPFIMRMDSDNDASEKDVAKSLIRSFEELIDNIKYSLKDDFPKKKKEIKVFVSRIKDAISRYKKNEKEDKGFNSNNVLTLFRTIAQGLKKFNIKVFVLWDNFERIVSSKNIDPKSMTFFKSICEHEDIQENILIVFSGSNFLQEVVSMKQGNIYWNEVLTRSCDDYRVGNLEFNEFQKLLDQPEILDNGKLHYSKEALDYLYQYTNGHAYYSALFAKNTLDLLREKPLNRNCIYPSDIYNAIFKTGSAKENIVEKRIFQDIEDNIPVKCVGRKLAEMIVNGSIYVSKLDLQNSVIEQYPQYVDEEAFEKGFEVLKARDFIEYNQENYLEVTFTSDLFLSKFYRINVPDENKEIQEQYKKDQELAKLITDNILEQMKENPQFFKGDTKLIADNIALTMGDNGVISQARDITTNYNYNIQNISNVFNTLLTAGDDPKKVSESLLQLPKFQDYIPVNYKVDEDDDTVITRAIDNYAYDLSEGYYLASEENETKSIPIWEVLKMEEEEFNEFLIHYDVSDYFLEALEFAKVLEQYFDLAFEDTDLKLIDYSPVIIMYCKVVESALKEYHIQIYGQVFNTLRTNMKKHYSKEFYTWGEISNLTLEQQSKLTLGSFKFPLNINKNVNQLIRRHPGESNEWSKHKQLLEYIDQVRNPSAHGNKDEIQTKSKKDKLVELLIDDEGFLRIIELVQKKF